MKQKLKKLLKNFLPIINRLPFNNRVSAYGNKIIYGKADLRRCRIKCFGKNNVITFLGDALLTDCIINIYGNNNIIEIGTNVIIRKGSMSIEDDNNLICIGNGCKLTGQIHFACIEGTRITIGEDCLFSYDITLRTGDGHSILDMEGNRINRSEDIIIGNHVWVGHKATLGRGVQIADNSIVATSAVVTKKFLQSNTIIAGVPAKVVKENVDWCFKRI